MCTCNNIRAQIQRKLSRFYTILLLSRLLSNHRLYCWLWHRFCSPAYAVDEFAAAAAAVAVPVAYFCCCCCRRCCCWLLLVVIVVVVLVVLAVILAVVASACRPYCRARCCWILGSSLLFWSSFSSCASHFSCSSSLFVASCFCFALQRFPQNFLYCGPTNLQGESPTKQAHREFCGSSLARLLFWCQRWPCYWGMQSESSLQGLLLRPGIF